MTTMRVAVLGAGGFIGSRVLSRLRETAGVEPLHVYHRRPPPDASVPSLQLDSRDSAALADLARGCDALVNCVTGDGRTIVEGTRALIAAVAASPRRPRLVHFSSMAAYGEASGCLDETAPLRGDLGEYSAAKRDSEQLLAASPALASSVILRPGIVYGPGSTIWSGLIGDWLCAGRLGDLGAAGAGTCNLVHVDDVALAVRAALQQPETAGRAYNLGMPAPPTWNGYFAAWAAALGVPCPRLSAWRLAAELHVTAYPLKLAEKLAGKVTRAGGGRSPFGPPLRPWLTELSRRPLRLNVERAGRELGLNWKPLHAGLAETASWFHNREHRSHCA